MPCNPYHPCVNIVFECVGKWNRYLYIRSDARFSVFYLQGKVLIDTGGGIAGNPAVWELERGYITRQVGSAGVVLPIYFPTVAIIFSKTD